VASAGAGQVCSLSLQPSQDTWTIRCDHFAQDAIRNQFDVAVVNQGDAPCFGTIRADLSGEEYGLRKARIAGFHCLTSFSPWQSYEDQSARG